jgi:hypothetical protein
MPSNGFWESTSTGCAKQESVIAKDISLLVSLIGAYRRELEYRAKQKEKSQQEAANGGRKAPSGYIGTQGVRETFSLLLLAVYDLDDAFTGGVRHLHKFADADGNIAIWFTTTVRLDPSFNYLVQATVKKHEFNEKFQIPQTVFNRVKELERSENPIAIPEPTAKKKR